MRWPPPAAPIHAKQEPSTMTTAYWCVLAAAFIPILNVGVAKFSGRRRFDNRRPREFLAQLEGYAQRANWAQQNGYEAFPPFAAAVIIAHQLGLEQGTLDLYALTFVGARIAYSVCYILDWATLRSLVWTLGMACVIGLFFSSAVQA
jgi:uncharacterized MAPEG superfamily protein